MNKLPVIIDCSSTHQDALAVITALASNTLDIKAITLTADGAAIDQAFDNIAKILTQAAATHIPVAKGAAAPLIQHDQFDIAKRYAAARLAAIDLPKSTISASSTALELMIQTLEAANEQVTLLSIGPLTNIALLLTARPDLKSKMKQIALFGGGAGLGDVMPAAELNIFTDPEAANIVFHANLPIMMAGLDVAHKAYITPDEAAAIRGINTPLAAVAAHLLDELAGFTSDAETFTGSIVYGSTIVAALEQPELFDSIHTHVDIEVFGDLTRGMTVVNQIAFLEMPENATVILNVDRAKFVEYMTDAVKQLH